MSLPLGNSKLLGSLDKTLLKSIDEDYSTNLPPLPEPTTLRLADAESRVTSHAIPPTPPIASPSTPAVSGQFTFEQAAAERDSLFGGHSPMSMSRAYAKTQQANVAKDKTIASGGSKIATAVLKHNELVNEPLLSSEEKREDSVEHKETQPLTAVTPEDELEMGNVPQYQQIQDSFNVRSEERAETGVSRMLQEMLPERYFIFFGLLALCLASLCQLAFPQIIGQFIDKLSQNPPLVSAANRLIVYLIIITSALALLNFANMSLLWLAGHRVVTRLRKQLFKCIVYREVAFFDATRTGELISRLSGDVGSVNTALTTEIAEITQRVVMVLGSLSYMFYLSWDLTLISIAVAPVLGFVGHKMARFFHSIAKKANDESARSTIVAEETISCMRTVKSFAQEPTMLDRFYSHVNKMYGFSRKTTFAKAGQRAFVYYAGSMGVCLVLYYGAVQVSQRNLTGGDLLTFILYGLQVGEKSGQIMDNWGALKTAAGASQRVFELIDAGEDWLKTVKTATTTLANGIYDEHGQRIGESDTIQAPIVFSNVFFRYPARPDKSVLKGLSLTLRPGTVVALVGSSGGGKSTLMAMIERFYKPTRGTVTWAGIDVNRFDSSFYHKHVAYVGQEPVLFCTTIRDNVLFGVCSRKAEIPVDEEGNPIIRSDTVLCYDVKGVAYTQADVERVCAAANAHEFISQWPKGYNTVVGERGTSISGGQKQRIAIARAMLMNAPVLLLDEATSALDNESEQLVQVALDRLMAGRMTLMIAHRLSTTRNADYIAVVIGGQIVEYGSPAELEALNGQYCKLARLGQKLEKDRDREVETAVESK